jgi:hypothetical protein
MATDRQIERTVALCMNIMDRFHDGERSPRSKVAMGAEIQAVAAWILDLGLTPNEVDERLLLPLESRLLARYGHELGVRFYREFRGAFETFQAYETAIVSEQQFFC